ncbi:MAG: hypothetical protein JNL82_05400 [Myxococcales bacterium]|nr:hypothetical protein [Myxococcales bacterium]
MNEPRQTPSLQQLVAAEREAAADPAVEARVWAGVEHRLVHGPPPPTLPAPSSGLALTTILKGIGGLLLTAGAIGGAVLLTSPDEPAAAAAPALPPLTARADEPAPILAPRLVPPPAPPTVHLSEEPDDPDTRPPSKATRAKLEPADVTRPRPPLDLEAELRLVARIRAALRRGDPDAALAAIAEHRRDFKAGALIQERDAHEVEAVCAAGRGDEARALADAFVRRWPESTHRARVAAACPRREN